MLQMCERNVAFRVTPRRIFTAWRKARMCGKLMCAKFRRARQEARTLEANFLRHFEAHFVIFCVNEFEKFIFSSERKKTSRAMAKKNQNWAWVTNILERNEAAEKCFLSKMFKLPKLKLPFLLMRQKISRYKN